jgi:hypothetical protein
MRAGKVCCWLSHTCVGMPAPDGVRAKFRWRAVIQTPIVATVTVRGSTLP